ncbi:MAG: TolC family protein [Candidatus Omnitrophota bacterium]|nr:TolC family protein [Candidatus Omnitrophota bacterium]
MKITKIRLFPVLCILLCSGITYADELISWQECLYSAKKNNPDLISAAEQVKQAGRDIDIDISNILPQIDGEIRGKRTKVNTKKPANSYSYTVSASQLVFDGFKTSSEVTNALKTFNSKLYNYDVVSSDIRLGLRSAFTSLMRAQALILITENIAERRKQNLELVRLRYEGGREHKGAFLTAQADVAQAEFEIAQAKRSVLLAQRELSKELGLDKMKSMEVDKDFSLMGDYDAKPELETIVQMTPFLKELIAKKEAADYNLNSKEADFFPKVYVDGAFGRTNNDWPPKKNEWSAGFSVDLPLFEGGSRIFEVSKARSELMQSKAEEKGGKNSVLVTLERSWKDLQDAITNVSVKQHFLVAGEERAKISRAQYASGLTSFNDWIIIENNLVIAQKAYLNAQADMLYAEAYWIQAIGGTLEYDQK